MCVQAVIISTRLINQRKGVLKDVAWNLAPSQLLELVISYYSGSTLIADFVKDWPGDLTILDDRPASSKSRT